MLETYGKGTHVACSECGRKIFITEAEVNVRDGKRCVELTCISPGCVAYNKPRLYDEEALEIHGTAAAG
jgi:hypothetical protein